MGGVQAKLTATEKEAEKARKESHAARDAFNAVKKKRSALIPPPSRLFTIRRAQS
jgi:hypothetical protein